MRRPKPPESHSGGGRTPLLSRLKVKITDWYQGTYVPEPPGSPFRMGSYQQHWTSRLLHVCIDFYLKEWKWLLVFVVSLVVAIAKL